MSYRIVISSIARSDFKNLDIPIRTKIQKAILLLETNQFPSQSKHLKGKDLAQYRLRVGDYRILYDVYRKNKTVLVIRICHRKDIYR